MHHQRASGEALLRLGAAGAGGGERLSFARKRQTGQWYIGYGFLTAFSVHLK
jgi:hypothetical protein